MKKIKLLFLLLVINVSVLNAQSIDKEEDKVFLLAQNQPLFPGCEEFERTSSERNNCALNEMLKFIYTQLVYPELARENGVEGTVYLKFIIETDGSITNIEMVRDIGAGCGDAAIQVVKAMPKWLPGMQDGKIVRVQYNLPIRFMNEREKSDKRHRKKNKN